MHAEPASPGPKQKSLLAAINKAVAERRVALHEKKDETARGPLFDALMQLAGQAMRAANEEATTATLMEAQALLPTQVLNDTQWRVRSTNLYRAKGALAQHQGQHGDAVAAFTTAAVLLPSDSEGNRDAMAARLQVLVRLARSRLAIGQAAETQAEMLQCETVIETLAASIPSQALDTIRSAVLSHSGAALALLGNQDAAEEKFNASLALIDRLGASNVAGLRQQVIALRADMLSKAGNASEAAAPAAVNAEQPDDVRGGGPADDRSHGVHNQEGHKSD